MPEIQTDPIFYSPWPKFGKRLNFQWGESRHDIAILKAVARAQVQDVETGDDEVNASRILAGLEFGELVTNSTSFKNQFRLFYDKDEDKFCIQRNTGTELAPTWVDYLCIDQANGLVTVNGLDAGSLGIGSDGGFYGLPDQRMQRIGEVGNASDTVFVPPYTNAIWFNATDFYLTPIKSGQFAGTPVVNAKNSFGVARTFNASGGEWVINHNFGVSPVMAQVFDDQDKAIIPGEVDVSDPNTAYFYFDTSISGKVIIATGGLGAAELLPLDPFYLVVRQSDKSNVPRFSDFADVVFDRDDFYVTYRSAQNQATVSLARSPGSGGGSGSLSTVTDGTNTFTSVSELNFSGTDFYLSKDLSGNPVVNIRNTSTAGAAYVHTQGSAASEWTVTHNLSATPVLTQVFNQHDRIIEADEVDVSNPNVTYFYFSSAVAGKAMITSSAGVETVGEVNTASNLGSGTGVFAQKSGVDLQFKSLVGSGGLSISATSTQITIATTDGIGGGFYGIYLRESDGNPPTFKNDTIIFDSADFYLHPNSVGKPTVSFRRVSTAVSPGATYVHTQSSPAVEWIVSHNLNSSGFLVQTFSQDDKVIGFNEADVSNPNITYFYFTTAVAGKAIVTTGIGTSGGETNTASNVGSGTGLFAQKSGVDLQFKSLVAANGSGIILTSSSTEVNLSTTFYPSKYVHRDGSTDITGHQDFLNGIKVLGKVEAEAFYISNGGNLFTTAGLTKLEAAGLQLRTTGDIGLVASGDVNVTATTDVNVNASDDVILTATDNIDLTAGTAVSVTASAGDITLAPSGVVSVNNVRITNVATPVATTDAARLADLPPAFYGLVVRESDGNPPAFKDDTLIFNSDDFYLAGSTTGNKPTVNLRYKPVRYVHTQDSLNVEWQVAHNFGSDELLFNVIDNRKIVLTPLKVDLSNFNTAFFYFNVAKSGKAVLLRV